MNPRNLDSYFSGTRGEIFQNNAKITDFTEKIELYEVTVYIPKPTKKVEVYLEGVIVANDDMLKLLGSHNASFSIRTEGIQEKGNQREEKKAIVQNIRFKENRRRLPTPLIISLIGEGTSIDYSNP